MNNEGKLFQWQETFPHPTGPITQIKSPGEALKTIFLNANNPFLKNKPTNILSSSSFSYSISTISHLACSKQHSIVTIRKSLTDVDNNRSSRCDSSSNNNFYKTSPSRQPQQIFPSNLLEFVFLPRDIVQRNEYQFQNSRWMLQCNPTYMQPGRKIAYRNEDQSTTSWRR